MELSIRITCCILQSALTSSPKFCSCCLCDCVCFVTQLSVLPSFSSLHLFNSFVAVTDTNSCHVLRRLLGEWEESHWIYFQVSICAMSCAARYVVSWILCKLLSALAAYLTMAPFSAKTNSSLNLTFPPAVTEPPAPSQSRQTCFLLLVFRQPRE